MARYSAALAALFLSVACAQYSIVDVERVPASGDSSAAVVHPVVTPAAPVIECDILIAGGGMGGIAAALRAAQRGHRVCLTEETGWIGGQTTAGGVPALDENKFMEIAGGTRSYYAFREGVREWYRRHHRIAAGVDRERLNPGACYVSQLCFEPRAALDVLTAMLKPVRVFLRTEVFDLELRDGRIVTALAWQFDRRQAIRFRPRFVLDATEAGDLLPLARVPYVVGSEARSETGEPHAAEAPNTACVQSFTYPFVVERRDGEPHPVDRPAAYEQIVKRQAFTLRIDYPVQMGWKGVVHYRMFGEDPPVPNNMSPGPFFGWRRLLARRNFEDVPADLALMSWPRQDYAAETLLDQPPERLAQVLQRGKQTSLAFLYWLQHDLGRDDGRGKGYPELVLRPDVLDTADGLSKAPYVRESRRIRARGRVVEQDIVEESQPGPRARWFADSIGTGFYMVDIHPCGAGERGRMMMPRPFQVPMSALEPREGPSNFLPAGKNIGVTHLTNGAFRLHPVEWNVGEAAAVMASLSLAGARSVERVQTELAQAGVPLVWFDDLRVDDPGFAAIHLAAIRGLYPLGSDLHASPGAPLTRAEAARALAAWHGRDPGRDAIRLAVVQGWMATDHRNWFHPDLPFAWSDLREDKLGRALPALAQPRNGPVTRREWAVRLVR